MHKLIQDFFFYSLLTTIKCIVSHLKVLLPVVECRWECKFISFHKTQIKSNLSLNVLLESVNIYFVKIQWNENTITSLHSALLRIWVHQIFLRSNRKWAVVLNALVPLGHSQAPSFIASTATLIERSYGEHKDQNWNLKPDIRL